jgi:hypothetical protein
LTPDFPPSLWLDHSLEKGRGSVMGQWVPSTDSIQITPSSFSSKVPI